MRLEQAQNDLLAAWGGVLISEHVPPNLRAIHILEVQSESCTAPTPTELNARLGWPKQTIHRLCQTLIEAGIMAKHDKRLYPRHRASLLATGLANLTAALVGCHQILLQLAHDSVETANFVRPKPRGMNYIDRVESNWAFRVALPIGTQVPFHCTARGKLFMASLPAARRRAFLSSLQCIHRHRIHSLIQRYSQTSVRTSGGAVSALIGKSFTRE